MSQQVLDNQGREKFNGYGHHEVPWEMHRHVSGLGGISCYLLAGQSAGHGLNAAWTMTANQFVAVPFISPGGKIDQLACKLSTASGTQLARIGLYTNYSLVTPRPAALLVGSSEFSATGAAATYTYDTDLRLEPGQLYWAAIWGDGGGTTPQAYRLITVGSRTLFGTTSMGAGENTGMYFVSTTYTYGAMRSLAPLGTFPGTYTGAPAIGLRIAA